MPMQTARFRLRLPLALGLGLALAACDQGFDPDLRNLDRRRAAPAEPGVTVETAPRPTPDARGVISYESYQVVAARQADTVASVAERIGVDAAELASFNGLEPATPLRGGEILALPRRVPASGGASTGTGTGGTPGAIDITSLAGAAIDRAEPGRETAAAAPATDGREPVRHRVARGETAFSIARLYGVSVNALAEWNGLGPDFAVREGQYLMIPLAVEPEEEEDRRTAARVPEEAEPEAPEEPDVTAPGEGSPTPVPPSASQPLPEDDTRTAAEAEAEEEPVADLSQDRTEVSATARFALPVNGSIIRTFAPGRNEGIDIAAAAGTPVRAAASGTVAAITRDVDGVPILVIRHEDNLLTIYQNLDDLAVERGDSVRQGQQIATVRAAESPFLHFEIRQGFDAVDPMPYLE